MISSERTGTPSQPGRYPLDAVKISKTWTHPPIYPLPALDIISVLDRDTLSHMVDLVDSDKTRGKFKLFGLALSFMQAHGGPAYHVVTQ